jgi:hypothetical protein
MPFRRLKKILDNARQSALMLNPATNPDVKPFLVRNSAMDH